MDHVAIMKKSWGLLPKILTGEKTIESRRYSVKASPWGRVKTGDTVYFKNSGESVTVRAEVSNVKSFEDLSPNKVKQILSDYGQDDGLEAKDVQIFYERFKNKKYCLLISLKNPQKIKSFHINKKGFGSMAAWITIDSIRKIKV